MLLKNYIIHPYQKLFNVYDYNLKVEKVEKPTRTR